MMECIFFSSLFSYQASSLFSERDLVMAHLIQYIDSFPAKKKVLLSRLLPPELTIAVGDPTTEVGAKFGLALQNRFVALIVLPCLQNLSSSGAAAPTNVDISDVATAAERGIFIRHASLGDRRCFVFQEVYFGCSSRAELRRI